jgi:glycosyltransferase involved in cell wall biosynthesis
MISVIICSRDRISQLRACIERLARSGSRLQREWELIIVDNGSVATIEKHLASEFRSKGVPLRVIREPVQGLARARNRGIKNATGSVIAFTDDDCLVDAGWLEEIDQAFKQSDDLMLLGGRVESPHEDNVTIATRSFRGRESIRSLLDIQQYLIGCNFAIRQSVVQMTGEFDTCLGAGVPACAAEDIDYFYRIYLNGGKLEYIPGCRVVHAHGRENEDAIRKIRSNYVYGRGFWYAKRVLMGEREFVRYLYWELRSTGETMLKLKILRGFFHGLVNYALRRRRQLID